MHLLIDGQALQTSTSRQRGIGRYSSNLLRAVVAARPNWRIEIVQNSALAPLAAEDLHGLPVLAFGPPLSPHVKNQQGNERYYADWLTAHGADGVLVLSHCEGWEAIVPSFCGSRPKLFGIAYDLIPLLYPEYYLTDFGVAHWYAHRFRNLLRCDALLAISEATARDVRRLGGFDAPLVVNIGGAVDPLFEPLSPGELSVRAPQIRARFGLHRDFLLYVGALDYRKNLCGAIQAFAALPPEFRAALDLVVVCRMKPGERASVAEIAKRAGVASALRLIASAGDEDLRALYQMCRLFFFPSLYEGLGLPILEALHCGAPVVTSQCSSLPEYAGSVSWMGDPHSPKEMARVLEQALAEPREARSGERRAFARTFSWQQTAERACAVMERCLMGRGKPVRRRRRLAWVTTFTKEASGQIEYAVDMLPRLAEHFDIDVIAASGAHEAPEALTHRFLILTRAEVSARHAALPYDTFIYQLESPPHGRTMLDLMRKFPGLVVLHNCSSVDLQWLSENNWRQARDLNASITACAAWIESAIDRQERSDGLWRGLVVESLAECGDEAAAILDSWAALRLLGQQTLAAGW
jgi:glycosyltransferase involved in cell wall biosynthesis